MARGDDGAGAAGRFPRLSFSRTADEGLGLRKYSRICPLALQRRLLLFPRSRPVLPLFLFCPSSSEEKLDVPVVPCPGTSRRRRRPDFSRVAMMVVRYAVVRDVASTIAVWLFVHLEPLPHVFSVGAPTLRELSAALRARLVLLVFSCFVPRQRFPHTLFRSGSTLTVSRD